MTTITSFTCVKDGIHFIEAWLENTRQADYIVVQDGGSTDGTLEILLEEYKKNPQRITLLLQKEDNEKFKWNEEVVRNQCLGLFKTEWILLQDVDELIEDEFWEWFRNTDHNDGVEKKGYYLPHKNLWLQRDMFNMREPWYPDLTLRLFKNHRGFFWVGAEHASLWKMGGMCSPNDPETPPIFRDVDGHMEPICFVHYHRWEPEYAEAVLTDSILHHSHEKKNMQEMPMLARLRKHPTGAGLIRKRFM